MFNTLINCIKGVYTVEVKGHFPERILNIASVSGIYLRDIRRKDSETISFSVSKKAYEKLLQTEVEGCSLSLTDCYGFPVFCRKHKKRIVLFLLPVVFIMVSAVFSHFVWKVEITGGDKELQEQVLKKISAEGVHFGALKHKIDQYDVKRTAIMEIDDLSWMWVDIRGTTAKVKIRKRSPKPDLIAIHEPSDVIATHSGIIDKMYTYCGVPLVKEGDWVKKGQLLVTGVFRSENENIPTYYHHATADITVRFTEEKAVLIPKTTIKKVPTGKEKSIFGVKIKKNKINFSLNSRISYKEYDKIEKKYALSFLPFHFFKTTYREARVEYIETDIANEIENRRKTFLSELQQKGIEVTELTEELEERDDSVTVTFSADCRIRTDKEVPINYEISNLEGETDGKNS